MTDTYIGEIRRFGGSFAPEGWLLCEGQLLERAEYPALFEVIGTRFGGGETTFALPNLNDSATSTNDVACMIATAGRMPVQPQLQVEP